MLHKTLAKHFLLYHLSKYERSHLIESFELWKCQKNTVIFEKDSIGHLFFIIRSGEVAIEDINQNKKIKLKRGNYFGDLALIYAIPRSGSVKSLSDCSFYCINNRNFRKTVQEIVKKNLVIKE